MAAYDAGLEPLLVLTKSDLASAETLLETYAPLGVPYVVTSHEHFDADATAAVREHLKGGITAFVGHSGVGKTTLVNALVERQRATGLVNAVTGRGRHTTTSALALPLSGAEGWVIDTPGCAPSASTTSIRPGSSTPSRSGAGHGGLSAGLQPRRTRLRAGRLGRRRARGTRPVVLAAAAARDA